MVCDNVAYQPGDRDLSRARSRLLLRQVHLQGHRPGIGDLHPDRRRGDWADRHHDQPAAQGVFVPHVPVRRRLRRRAAVRARHRQGRRAAGALLGGPMRVLPDYRRRGRESGRLRSRLFGGPLRGFADHLRVDGAGDGRHQSSGPGRRPSQGANRRHTGRVRGELYVRHHGLGDRHRHFRPRAAAHRSRRRLQGLRGEAGRRQEGDRRARHGLAPLGGARVQGADRRQGGRPQGRRGGGDGARCAPVRPAHPPRWPDHGSDRGHRPERGRRGRGRGRTRSAGDGAAGTRSKSRTASCSPCRWKASTFW